MIHPIALCDETGSCTVSLQFCAFSLPRKFLQIFSKVFQALLFVEFNFVLKSWPSNSCAICAPTKIPSFFLASLTADNFCLKWPNSSLSLSTAFTNIISNWTWCTVKVNIFFTYPLKQDVPHYLPPKAGCATLLTPKAGCATLHIP